MSVLVYVLLRYVVRTPFGLALQGVRDDPVRMASLGYNVVLHRTLAFAFAGFVASLAGVLFVWWNGHIDPASIDLSAMIDVLVIAVIGGLYRLEGAWLGAFVFVMLNNYSRQIDFVGPRFHTLIGLVFLAIVLVSPAGLAGIWERAQGALGLGGRGGGAGRRRRRRRRRRRLPHVMRRHERKEDAAIKAARTTSHCSVGRFNHQKEGTT